MIAKFFFNKNNRNKGVTILELLVGIMVGSIIIQLAFFGFDVNRRMYLSDAVKNDIYQNLRTVFDIVGPTITQAGQGIGNDPRFPVISIEPYPIGSTNSQITIRQLKLTTKLPVCQTVTAGSQTQIYVIDTSTDPDNPVPAGCDPVSTSSTNHYPANLGQWKVHRSANGGRVRAYIYNGNGTGEFLNYTGEKIFDASGVEITTDPTENQVASAAITVSGNLTNEYQAGSATQLLILEERSYRLNSNNTLEAIVDGNETNLVNNVDQFRVTATVRQGNTSSECTRLVGPGAASVSCSPGLASDYQWSQITGLRVDVKPKIPANEAGLSKKTIDDINDLSQTQSFYPRNLINFVTE